MSKLFLYVSLLFITVDVAGQTGTNKSAIIFLTQSVKTFDGKAKKSNQSEIYIRGETCKGEYDESRTLRSMHFSINGKLFESLNSGESVRVGNTCFKYQREDQEYKHVFTRVDQQDS